MRIVLTIIFVYSHTEMDLYSSEISAAVKLLSLKFRVLTALLAALAPSRLDEPFSSFRLVHARIHDTSPAVMILVE